MQDTYRLSRAARLLAGVALTSLAGAAFAQSPDAVTPPAAQAAPPAPETAALASEADGGGLETIIVTARKRQESVQDVPVAVTAISAETVRQQDLTSIEKIAARTPNFTVGRASNGSGAQLTMRGIGSSSTSIGIEQSVATVVDGVYFGQGRIIQEGFFDLGRVEILKGPQALFFGKNATAGVISITTADPGSDPEFFGRVGYEFRSEQVVGELIGSGPITDTLGVRLAVRGSKMYGGYYRNVADPVSYNTLDIATGVTNPHTALPAAREAPGEKELLGRFTVKWDPTDNFVATFKVSGDYNKVNNSSWNYVNFDCATGRSSLNPIYECKDQFVTHQNNMPTDIAANFPFARDDGQLYNRYKSYQATANLVYTLPTVTFTSVTNYQWNNNRWTCACDFQSSNTGTWATENSTWKAFSTELRALTSFDGPLNFLVGGLYQDTKRDFEQYIMFANIEDSTQDAARRYQATSKVSFTNGETLALFGQATFKIMETLELAGGVRYTRETKDSFFTQPYNNAAVTAIFRPQNSPDGLGEITANQKFTDWSPEATLTWKPTRDILVYGAYKTAYKSGGFSNGGINSGFSPNPFADLTFEPETVEGFEAGLKTTLADNQLRFNVGLYTYKYSDLQVDFFNSPIFAFQTLTADARTKGVELEFEYAPRSLAGLNLRGSLNYNRARYTDFPLAPCYAGQTPATGCNLAFNAAGNNFTRQNLTGSTLSVAPEWTATLGAGYDTAVGNGMKFGISADARYSDDYLASGFGNPFSRQNSYINLDASIRFGAEDDRWQIAVIGKNLTNRFYVTGVVDGPSTGSGTGTPAGVHADQLGFGTLPRTVMVQLSTRF
ncbi:TonB-dependent receptor [Sphingomonas sp. 1P06PA]|uniref:TonB-dependent receptor n=1 Tax=Sphingomonas sp. 1P06PA TaxID=554121 RepID=UPI0039A45354